MEEAIKEQYGSDSIEARMREWIRGTITALVEEALGGRPKPAINLGGRDVDAGAWKVFMRRMSNVLNEEKKQQVVALGRLGWSLRQIEQATSVRRETAGAYLKAAGIAVSGRGRRPSRASRAAQAAEVSTDPSSPEPAIPSGDVSIDPGSPKPAISLGEVSTDPGSSRPAISEEVSADPGTPGPAAQQAKAGSEPSPPPRPWPPPPTRAPQASACEPYREVIEEALERGRNAMAIWQDLVDDHGFQAGYASVKRFVIKLRGSTPVEARVVIRTAPGDEAQVDYGEGPMVRDAATGKYKRTRLFVLTLGYSRKSVRLVVPRSRSRPCRRCRRSSPPLRTRLRSRSTGLRTRHRPPPAPLLTTSRPGHRRNLTPVLRCSRRRPALPCRLQTLRGTLLDPDDEPLMRCTA